MVGIAATFAVTLAARAAIAATAATLTATATIAARATAVAAPIATTITAIATGLARFAGRTGVFQFLAGFLIDDAHGQANLAARIDFENLDVDFLAFGHDVGRLLDTLVLHFGDVDEAVLATHEVHEGAEVHDVDDLALVDLADFGFLDNAEDPLTRGFDLGQVGRRDLDQAFVVDVHLRAGFRPRSRGSPCRRCR